LVIAPGRYLDHATVSTTLCDGLLKYFLPILADATWVTGELSLDLGRCEIDLDQPQDSIVFGAIYIHGIQAGVKNELIAEARSRLMKILGQDGFDAVHLVDGASIEFEVRDGRVWHEGLEFGLPGVSPELVVTTSGSVSFDDQLDLRIGLPLPLHLVREGPLAELVGNKSLVLTATGSFSKPQVELADDSLFADLLPDVAGSLAKEPLQTAVEGIREAIQNLDDIRRDRAGEGGGEDVGGATDDASETRPILERLRERMKIQTAPSRRPTRGDEP
jgi:hypothetical protein